jgi:hypothetical protein
MPDGRPQAEPVAPPDLEKEPAKVEESLITGKFYGTSVVTTSAHEENGELYTGT